MGGSYNVGHHVFVESVDGCSEDFGEVGEGFSYGFDAGSFEVSETLGECRVGTTGLVVGLSAL